MSDHTNDGSLTSAEMAKIAQAVMSLLDAGALDLTPRKPKHRRTSRNKPRMVRIPKHLADARVALKHIDQNALSHLRLRHEFGATINTLAKELGLSDKAMGMLLRLDGADTSVGRRGTRVTFGDRMAWIERAAYARELIATKGWTAQQVADHLGDITVSGVLDMIRRSGVLTVTLGSGPRDMDDLSDAAKQYDARLKGRPKTNNSAGNEQDGDS